ncbi:MAG: VgrG-related protein [Chloroflexi bacterium]|nr:VgrG-related protein [Chloroflexota bacterium]
MPTEPHLSHVSLKIEGTLASAEIMSDLLAVVVDHSLHLPSMFTLKLFSHDMKWLREDTFREGKKIEIFYGERSRFKLLSGKIASLEPDLQVTHPTLLVRGYDLSHKLYRGRHRRSFNQVTDSDLAKKLMSEAGLRAGKIDDTTEVHEYVFQNNQTNAEFLLERARLLGYELWVDEDALNFRKPSPNGQAVKLAWGESLISFRPRLSTVEQVNQVEVRGWDPRQKRAVVGRASNGNGAPEIGESKPGANIAKQTWGEAKFAIVDQFVRSPAEADALAQAALDEMASVFVEAEGACLANGDILPGRQVQIDGVGTRFNGTYYVTQVVHEWTAGAAMLTRFTVSGRRDRGVWSILHDSTPKPVGMQGMVIGIVTNNKDPDELGRVRVKFPWLSDDDESAWARIVTPMAGNGRGMFYLPEVDDEVLVGFEHGDIHRPFIMGALWNGKDKLPMNAAQAVGGDGKVNKRVLKSRSGHTITLDDTSGGEEITIVDKTGSNKIIFHSPDNSMQIKVQGDLTIEAQGKINIKGTSGVEMSSQMDMTIKSQTGLDVSTQAQLSLSGQASAELSSAMNTTVKGSLINVQGTGPVNVSGLPIKLN